MQRALNGRGITNRGKHWNKGGRSTTCFRNEAYTGAAVWGRTSKVEKAQEPVRVEGAWPALVSRELFDAVQEAMRDRAPKVQRPARVGSKFLLSGLLKCGVCGRLRQALQSPRSQERAVRLLHLRHPVQGGSGDVQRPLPERSQVGGVRRREGSRFCPVKSLSHKSAPLDMDCAGRDEFPRKRE